MIEVYKTNVQTNRQASRTVGLLTNSPSGVSVNFDLQDPDRILRIRRIQPGDVDSVARDVIGTSFQCEALK